jgi:hypothetical protein
MDAMTEYWMLDCCLVQNNVEAGSVQDMHDYDCYSFTPASRGPHPEIYPEPRVKEYATFSFDEFEKQSIWS